jgi:hypothetical protein
MQDWKTGRSDEQSRRSEERRLLYIQCRMRTKLKKKEWGRLFALGNMKNCDQVVSHKENPPDSGKTSKGVNLAESLACQLLHFLHDQKYNLKKIQFDENGVITDIPLKTELDLFEDQVIEICSNNADVSYVVYEGGSMTISFRTGLQLSVVLDDGGLDLAIFDRENNLSPDLFDLDDNVIDVLCGCSVDKAMQYVQKLLRES